MEHGVATLIAIENMEEKEITGEQLDCWMDKAISIASSLNEKIYQSREKDYTNPYRKMIYDSETEMNNVLGNFDKNSFIRQKQIELEDFKKEVAELKNIFSYRTS